MKEELKKALLKILMKQWVVPRSTSIREDFIQYIANKVQDAETTANRRLTTDEVRGVVAEAIKTYPRQQEYLKEFISHELLRIVGEIGSKVASRAQAEAARIRQQRQIPQQQLTNAINSVYLEIRDEWQDKILAELQKVMNSLSGIVTRQFPRTLIGRAWRGVTSIAREISQSVTAPRTGVSTYITGRRVALPEGGKEAPSYPYTERREKLAEEIIPKEVGELTDYRAIGQKVVSNLEKKLIEDINNIQGLRTQITSLMIDELGVGDLVRDLSKRRRRRELAGGFPDPWETRGRRASPTQWKFSIELPDNVKIILQWMPKLTDEERKGIYRRLYNYFLAVDKEEKRDALKELVDYAKKLGIPVK